MSVATVHLFASYAEMFGAAEIEVPVSSEATVRDLVDTIRALPGAELPATPRVAVNRVFAAPDSPVRPTDEIALIPPVAGG
jgi:molybdopterin converting factor small subunit